MDSRVECAKENERNDGECGFHVDKNFPLQLEVSSIGNAVADLKVSDKGNSVADISQLKVSDEGKSLLDISQLKVSDEGNSVADISQLKVSDEGKSLLDISQLKVSDERNSLADIPQSKVSDEGKSVADTNEMAGCLQKENMEIIQKQEENEQPEKVNEHCSHACGVSQEISEEYKTLSGHKFDEENVLRDEKGNKFQFNYCDDRWFNQQRYENIGEFDAKDGESQGSFFASENAKTTDDKLLILIHGSGVVRAGQWARRIIINDNLMDGSQIPYIKRAYEEGYEVVLFNTNENYNNGPIRGSEDPGNHALYVWDNFIMKAKAKHIAIMAHSYGGVVTVHLAKERTKEFLNKVFAVGFSDSVHSMPYNTSSQVKNFFVNNAVNWVTSNKEIDTPLSDSFDCFSWFSGGKDCLRVSAGDTRHEWTSSRCMDSVFKFFKRKLEQYGSPVDCRETNNDNHIDIKEDKTEIRNDRYNPGNNEIDCQIEEENVCNKNAEEENVRNKNAEVENVSNKDAEEENVCNKDTEEENVCNKNAEEENVCNKNAEEENVSNKETEVENVSNKETEVENVSNKETEVENVSNKDAEEENVCNKNAEEENVSNKDTEENVCNKDTEEKKVCIKNAEEENVCNKNAEEENVSNKETEVENVSNKNAEEENVCNKNAEEENVCNKNAEEENVSNKDTEEENVSKENKACEFAANAHSTNIEN